MILIKLIRKVKYKLTKNWSINIPCKSYQCGNPLDGYEYDCDYDTDIMCDECICCVAACGIKDPRNNKQVNFIFRMIQSNRCRKYWKHKSNLDSK